MTKLEIEPITPVVGAVIRGVDLRETLADEVFQQIRAAVLKHGVIFFRDQDLTQDQIADFMSRFGPLCDDPFSAPPPAPRPARDTVIEMPTLLTNRATAVWHLDSTLAPRPASFIALRALILPPVGGDTCWGSMYAAYETLSAPLRAMLDGLTAEHSAFKVLPLMGGGAYYGLQNDMRTVHPVVRVHPETGRKALFVNELWTESLVGLSSFESERLLAMLCEHARDPEFTMRWKWRVNDLALWDNRSFQHYAVRDYKDTRVLQKSLVAGDRPVGPMGIEPA